MKTWTRDSNAKRFDLIPVVSRKIKGVSEIRIQILVLHSKMYLVPTFGVPTPANSVPEGTGSIRQSYWSFLSPISDSCSPP
ncbi:hypothetical protein TNCV_2964691 [Trichonephila clavipes]|nr:hypothetical protein TNCV_2964691 [Trichonephila clavipes]